MIVPQSGSAPATSWKALPFQVVGTATGVQKSGNSVQLKVGALDTDFSTIQSVGSQ